MSKENIKTNAPLYRIVRPITTFLFNLFYRPTYIGIENIPTNGKIILAGNHTSILDPILLMSSTKRSIHFLSKIELFKGWKGIIFRHMGLIPVDRQNKTTHPLEEATKYLDKDCIILIFPEGTIGKNGLLPFKYGTVSLAHKTNTKIIPFVIKNKYKIFRKSITIEFLKPIEVFSNLEEENDKLRNMIKDRLENK